VHVRIKKILIPWGVLPETDGKKQRAGRVRLSYWNRFVCRSATGSKGFCAANFIVFLR